MEKITNNHDTNNILQSYNIYQTSNMYTLATLLKIRNPEMCGDRLA